MSASAEHTLEIQTLHDEYFTLSTDTLAKLVDPKSPDLLKELGGLDGGFQVPLLQLT